jgi:hypothetical protein
MRGYLPSGAKDPLVETRIKEIQTDIATTVPSMPDSWVSKKLQQLSEQDEKAKKEAERKEMEVTWKKWKKVSLWNCRIRISQKSHFILVCFDPRRRAVQGKCEDF